MWLLEWGLLRSPKSHRLRHRLQRHSSTRAGSPHTLRLIGLSGDLDISSFLLLLQFVLYSSDILSIRYCPQYCKCFSHQYLKLAKTPLAQKYPPMRAGTCIAVVLLPSMPNCRAYQLVEIAPQFLCLCQLFRRQLCLRINVLIVWLKQFIWRLYIVTFQPFLIEFVLLLFVHFEFSF